ncbi:MAG: xylulokinase [Nitrososphaeria archaeon]|nr:FGGY family carbohydrate kinase [Conexivisphaerales archaeon]
MAKYNYAGVDLGSSFIKGSVLDEDGTHIVTVRSKAPQILSPKTGWTEIDPFEYYFIFRRFLRKLLKYVKSDKIYLGFSSMAPVFIPVDNECYPLYRGILYNDTRAKKEIEELNPIIGDTVFKENGNPLNIQQWLPKILWYRKNYPNLYEKTWKFIELTTFIICKLTNKVITDMTMLQEEGVLNYQKKEISDKILDVMNLKHNMLPDYIDLNEMLEPFSIDGKEFYANAGTIDLIGSSVSLNMLEKNKLAIILGSTGVINYSATDPKPDKRLYLDLSPIPEIYYVNGCTSAAGIFLDYIMYLLGMKGKFKKMDKYYSENEVETSGLVMLPYILGERTPIFDPYAKSVIFGITNLHNKMHLIKAAIESIAFSMKHHYEILQELNYKFDRVYLTGGLSNLKIVQRTLPSVLEVPMIKIEEGDETIGDAKIAMVGSKNYKWGDIKSLGEKSIFGYKLDYEKIPYYDKNYVIYKELYARLKDMFKTCQ